MQIGELLRDSEQGLELDVMVSPNARRAAIGEIDHWRKRLVVKVKAPPEGGRANRELEEFLSTFFSCKVVVARGHTDRHKTVVLHCDRGQAEKAWEGRE